MREPIHEQVEGDRAEARCSCGWFMALRTPKYQERVFLEQVAREWYAHSRGAVVPDFIPDGPLSFLVDRPEWERAMFGSETKQDRIDRARRLSVPRRFR